MSYVAKIHDRPEMENPIYKCTHSNSAVVYIQRVEGDFDEWVSVFFDGVYWQQIAFLGHTKKEAIYNLNKKL